MDCSIQDLGALGEFAGTIALVVTVVHLPVQVRHAKGAMDANARAR